MEIIRNLVLSFYSEPHRYYHTINHIDEINIKINELYASGAINNHEKTILTLVAYFHDIVYEPYNGDNEAQSAELFKTMTNKLPIDLSADDKELVTKLIIDTANFSLNKSKLSRMFFELDTNILKSDNLLQLLDYEKAIFKEYQHVSISEYKQKRVAFLINAINVIGNKENLTILINYIRTWKPKIGVYAGSFNPFHRGHFEVLKKAERFFDKVIIARGVNTKKKSQDLFASPYDDRELKYREVVNFNVLLPDYLESLHNDAEVTLVRGIRNSTDLSQDSNMLSIIDSVSLKKTNTVFILCDKQFEHISSSSIREVMEFSPEKAKILLLGGNDLS